MCSIIGVGERLHKVLGQTDLGTLDSGLFSDIEYKTDLDLK